MTTRRIVGGAAFVAAAVAITGWIATARLRHDRLDAALVDAVARADSARVRRLLAEGARADVVIAYGSDGWSVQPARAGGVLALLGLAPRSQAHRVTLARFAADRAESLAQSTAAPAYIQMYGLPRGDPLYGVYFDEQQAARERAADMRAKAARYAEIARMLTANTMHS